MTPNHHFFSKFFFIYLLFFSINIQAESRTIIVGFSFWPPYEYVNNGIPSGIDIQIVKAVGKLMGVKFTFVLYPWSRGIEYIKYGKIDALMSLHKQAEREKFMYFPEEHLNINQNILITSALNTLDYHGNIAELNNKTIMVVRNNTYGSKFDQAKNFKRYVTVNTTQTIKMIAGNREELGIVSKMTYYFIAKKLNLLKKIKILKPEFNEEKLYLAFSRSSNGKNNLEHQQLAIRFSKALKKYKRSNEYKKMIGNYNL